MSYACVCSFHYILLEIKLEQGLVTVLDSRRKDPQDYADMTHVAATEANLLRSLVINENKDIILFPYNFK